MQTVYVVTAKVQAMYEDNYYVEVIGVTRTQERANALVTEANLRFDVLCVDCEGIEVEE